MEADDQKGLEGEVTTQDESDEPVFEIVCPDGLVRHRWYHSKYAALSNARFCTHQGCRRLYDMVPPKPPEEMPRCPGGLHHVALVPPQGRQDVIVDRPVDKTDLEVLLLVTRAVREEWTNAIYEDATCEVIANDMDDTVLSEMVEVGHMVREFFVYRDEDSLCAWNEQGGMDENLDTMLHVLLEPAEVTFVVSCANGSKTGAIANRIAQRLQESEPLLA